MLLSALPQVAPRILVLLRRAQQHQGEWVLPAGPQVVWPPEALLLVGSLHQVLLVSLPQAQPHPESPRRVRPVGLLVALPPVPQPLGLLASPPQVGQQQEKRQAVGSSPQRS